MRNDIIKKKADISEGLAACSQMSIKSNSMKIAEVISKLTVEVRHTTNNGMSKSLVGSSEPPSKAIKKGIKIMLKIQKTP